MQLKVFWPNKRKFYANASFDENRQTVKSPRGTARPSEEFVLLPATGFHTASGAPVFLGDAFCRTTGDIVETFIVGPLPAKGVLVSEFVLRRSKLTHATRGVKVNLGSEKELEALHKALPAPALSDEGLASLEAIGNVYENYAAFIPTNQHYCYEAIGWDGEFYRLVSCPFWQHSDHGLTYCRLTQNGSLTNRDEDYRKALAHFGSEAALEEADNDMLLWDQVKSCGVNDDWPEEDDD